MYICNQRETYGQAFLLCLCMDIGLISVKPTTSDCWHCTDIHSISLDNYMFYYCHNLQDFEIVYRLVHLTHLYAKMKYTRLGISHLVVTFIPGHLESVECWMVSYGLLHCGWGGLILGKSSLLSLILYALMIFAANLAILFA